MSRKKGPFDQIIHTHNQSDNIIALQELVICIVRLRKPGEQARECYLIWHHETPRTNYAVDFWQTTMLFEYIVRPLIEAASKKLAEDELAKLIRAVKAFLDHEDVKAKYLSVEKV